MKRRILFIVLLICGGLLVAIGVVADQALVWGLLVVVMAILSAFAGLIEMTVNVPLTRLLEVLNRLREGDDSARVLSDSNHLSGDVIRQFGNLYGEQRYRETAQQAELNRLSIVMQQMKDGVVITGVRGEVQMTNPAALALFDSSPENVIGGSFAELVRHHEIIDLWQRSVLTRDPLSNVIEIGRNGLFLQADVTPLISEDEKLDSVVILHDLTSIRRLETVRRDFISNVSHELRTPLASLRAVIETLQDGALNDPPAAARFLGRAEGEVDSMTQMVEELLELSRIESGRVPLRIELVPVTSVVSSALDRLDAQVMRNKIQLVQEISAELSPLYVDPARVTQVLTNLLHNAIKFTPDGGQIVIRATEKKGMVELSLSDNGRGIPAHALPRIFERFYKLDPSRTSGGTGLGLAIVRHIVQIHGGEIRVTSKMGQGSTFYFTLPTEETAERIAEAARGIVPTNNDELLPDRATTPSRVSNWK